MLNVKDYGLSPYREIWALQKQLFSELIEEKRNNRYVPEQYLLVGEHHPVYTLGFHGNADNLLVAEERLTLSGAECIRIERGGDITFHGPGQMVVYPIIDLESLGLGIKGYMDLLEDSVIELLQSFGIKGEKIDNAIGIWIDKGTGRERKICAMGVKCTRYITMHGLALNVNTDLSYFKNINPCGFIDKGVTSMQLEIGEEVDMEEVKHRFIEIFTGHFTSLYRRLK